MHIMDSYYYMCGKSPSPEVLLQNMACAGIWGGCIFSNPPKLAGTFEYGKDFEARLEELCCLTAGHKDRMFPILWIHPDEENISENLQKAVDAGVCGFLMVCSDFYVYEEKSMSILRQIAQLNKPVFFESGFLKDPHASSEYSRPLHWESLLSIPRLRFCLSDCAWPWVDECIALFTKCCNNHSNENSAQMFLSISTSLPADVRQKLFDRLYATPNAYGNILFKLCFIAEHEINKQWHPYDREP